MGRKLLANPSSGKPAAFHCSDKFVGCEQNAIFV